MGRRVLAMAAAESDVEVVAAIEHPSHAQMGEDSGLAAGLAANNVPLSSDWPHYASAVIDFSLPAAVDQVIDAAAAAKIPMVIATTGLSDGQKDKLAAVAKSMPVVVAPSMSPAVNVAMRSVAQIARSLSGVPGGVDVEIIERHHRFKVDAPSGTALRFGELIAEAIEPVVGSVTHVHGRHGDTGARTAGEIGYHAVRTGDDFGRHTIVFGMMGERIEVDVAASSRDGYATGAITAAKWLLDRPPGLYDMFDVLGLRE